jgi:hypothetical protein
LAALEHLVAADSAQALPIRLAQFIQQTRQRADEAVRFRQHDAGRGSRNCSCHGRLLELS